MTTAQGRSLASLSGAIGRSPAYLQQFVQCGSPLLLHAALRADATDASVAASSS